jgi:acyl-coenzyme A thioesterase PaaI-like protein
MTPQEFAQRLNRWYAGTMMQDMEMLHAGEGRARGRVEFKPHLRQLTGLFHAGVIMGLADTTATAAAMWEIDSDLAPSGEFRRNFFRFRSRSRPTSFAIPAAVLSPRMPNWSIAAKARSSPTFALPTINRG